MNKDYLVLSVVLVGVIGFLTVYSLGPPIVVIEDVASSGGGYGGGYGGGDVAYL